MRSSTISSISLLICLFSLAALVTASASADAAADGSAQLAPAYEPRLNEPLERYDNPPAPPRKMETSPRMISPYAGFISYQVNVNANGSSSHTTEALEATRNGSLSIRPTDRATVSNTRQTIALTAHSAPRHSNAPQMAGSPGSRLSLFQIRPYMERWMWTPTAMFL